MEAMDIKDAITMARKARGLTQAAAAEAIGVTSATWQNWERGRRAPVGAHINAICALLGVSPEELGFEEPVLTSPPKPKPLSYQREVIDYEKQLLEAKRRELEAREELLEMKRAQAQMAVNVHVPLLPEFVELLRARGLTEEAYFRILERGIAEAVVAHSAKLFGDRAQGEDIDLGTITINGDISLAAKLEAVGLALPAKLSPEDEETIRELIDAHNSGDLTAMSTLRVAVENADPSRQSHPANRQLGLGPAIRQHKPASSPRGREKKIDQQKSSD